jgi:hypothetical protein
MAIELLFLFFGKLNIRLAKSRNYQISNQGLTVSDYPISDSRKTTGCPTLQISFSQICKFAAFRKCDTLRIRNLRTQYFQLFVDLKFLQVRKYILFLLTNIAYCGEPPPVASPLTTRRVRASVYEGTSLLTVHTVDPHTVDRSCTPYIQCLYGINFNQSTALSLITSPCTGLLHW